MLNRLLYAIDRRLPRQHAGKRKETGLQHRIRAAAESRFAGNARRVDHVEAQLLGDDLFLHDPW